PLPWFHPLFVCLEETKEEKDSDSSSSDETKEEKDSDSSSSDESKKHHDKEEKDSDSSSSEETKEEKDCDSSSSDKSHDDSKSSSSEEDSGCPDDWTRFGQQCFIFINSPKTWAEAEAYCQFDGSNLASIHSYEENHFLQSLTRADTHNFPQAWIGGTDTMHFGLWTWSDGSRFLYENWSYKGKDGDADRCLKINYHCKHTHTHTHKHSAVDLWIKYKQSILKLETKADSIQKNIFVPGLVKFKLFRDTVTLVLS
uniref:C-type lectin domain-containing protein n=1 Tax=Oryzias latipes TaxID=8090 RepID=A0A3B3HPW6_ORYLA